MFPYGFPKPSGALCVYMVQMPWPTHAPKPQKVENLRKLKENNRKHTKYKEINRYFKFWDVILAPYFTFVTASKSFAATVKTMFFFPPQLGRNIRIALQNLWGPVGSVSAARDNRKSPGNFQENQSLVEV